MVQTTDTVLEGIIKFRTACPFIDTCKDKNGKCPSRFVIYTDDHKCNIARRLEIQRISKDKGGV